MTTYDKLLDQADNENITVIENHCDFSGTNIKGLYCDNFIALSKDLSTSVEKSCVLAEELGHHYTAVGDILNQSSAANRKQELRGRIFAYNKMVGLSGILDAFKAHCQNRYEIAEYLDVTEEFLEEALQYYRSKYGVSTTIDNYMIYFEPLSVLELYK